MIDKIYYTVFICLMITTSIKSQNSIDSLLAEIEINNKSLKASIQYWEAIKVSYKTGLNPSNPKVEYEYLNGSPAAAGNQTDLFILQQFDFPTSYIKKKQVANEQTAKIEFEQQAFRQDLLLKSKQYFLELIFLNKKRTELNNRLLTAQNTYTHFKKKLENGDANILDVNKAKLQLINLQNEVRINISEINQYNQKLTELNGGNEIIFNEVDYPLSIELPDFKTLEEAIEKNDPILKSYQQEKEITKKKMELSRAMAYPKIEGGYHAQKILGQSFQGVHLGITIPLWEGKNSVKHQKEQLSFSELMIENHSTEHFYEIKQLYEKYLSLKITLEEYQSILNSITSNNLLEKSLSIGEISSIQYFMELNYFYDSYDNYLNLEKDYNLTISELSKYEL